VVEILSFSFFPFYEGNFSLDAVGHFFVIT